MFRRTLLVAGLAIAFAGSASAETINYVAHLTGKREVPKTDSKGTGKFDATYDTTAKTLNYTLTFENLSGPATAAHIHGPANRNATAGVIFPLGDKNPTSPVSGSLTLTDDQAKELAAGKFYVNVHTAANPGGEIRGQIMHPHPRRKKAPKPATTTAS